MRFNEGNMSPKYLFALVIAFIAGLSCCLGIAHYYPLVPPPPPVSKVETLRVMVAKVDISVGTEIRADMIALADVPITELPIYSLSKFSDVYGKQAIYAINAGQPLEAEMFIDRSVLGTTDPEFIPPGYKIIPIDLRTKIGEKRVRDIQKVDLQLKSMIPFDNSDPKTVAENVNVYSCDCVSDDRYVLSLLLKEEHLERIRASKDRRLQIKVHEDVPELTIAVFSFPYGKNVEETAEKPTKTKSEELSNSSNVRYHFLPPLPKTESEPIAETKEPTNLPPLFMQRVVPFEDATSSSNLFRVRKL